MIVTTTHTPAPLKLDGTRNTRELGGYPTPRGLTATGRVLRSDAMARLSEADKAFLYTYGVRRVVDLRGVFEVHNAPCGLSGYKDVEVFSVSLLDNIHSEGLAGKFPSSMGELYCGLLEKSGAKIMQALRLISEAEGVTIVNCTAGKDRTGILSMLLLALAGVTEDEILGDYSVTEINLGDMFKRQMEKAKGTDVKIPEFVFRSEPKNMETALTWIKDNHGNAVEYCRANGLSEEELSRLQTKLL